MIELNKKSSTYYLATLAGMLSILLWASTIAFSKSAMDKEGDFNAAFYIYFYSGIAVFLILAIFQKSTLFFTKLKNLPPSYYFKTGIFFVINNVFLFIAISLARKNEELLIVTLLNYTWPIMIYVVRIFIFKSKIPLTAFLAGVILSLFGISMAIIEGYSREGFGMLIHAGTDNILAYSLAFLTAVSWALYSNLTVRYESRDDLAGIPVILLMSSLVFLIIQILAGKFSTIHLIGVVTNPELIYLILGPTSLAYLFWYFAIKNGNKILITALSLFIPLLSILILHIKLHLEISLYLWIATVLLLCGSYICYSAFAKSADSITNN